MSPLCNILSCSLISRFSFCAGLIFLCKSVACLGSTTEDALGGVNAAASDIAKASSPRFAGSLKERLARPFQPTSASGQSQQWRPLSSPVTSGRLGVNVISRQQLTAIDKLAQCTLLVTFDCLKSPHVLIERSLSFPLLVALQRSSSPRLVQPMEQPNPAQEPSALGSFTQNWAFELYFQLSSLAFWRYMA